MSLQKESEWEKEFVRRFPNTYYIGAEEVGGDFTKHTTFSREYFKDFVLYAVSNRENEIAEEVERLIQEYEEIGKMLQGESKIINIEKVHAFRLVKSAILKH